MITSKFSLLQKSSLVEITTITEIIDYWRDILHVKGNFWPWKLQLILFFFQLNDNWAKSICWWRPCHMIKHSSYYMKLARRLFLQLLSPGSRMHLGPQLTNQHRWEDFEVLRKKWKLTVYNSMTTGQIPTRWRSCMWLKAPEHKLTFWLLFVVLFL